MECDICSHEKEKKFRAKIMNKYKINYYYCKNCGYLTTEYPFWLNEAYEEPINVEDTGIMNRNLNLRNITSIIIYFLFDKNGQFVDYAGGYGVFTRLMRDIGFDFYWMDKYATNIFSKGFEYNNNVNVELITSFESFEHFISPIKELEDMLSISNNIIFSTEILPDPVPEPDEWWYYGLSHGQHISFYSIKTLKFIANKYNLNFYTLGNVHIITDKKLNSFKFNILKLTKKTGVLKYFKKKMKSKIIEDMNYIISIKERDEL